MAENSWHDRLVNKVVEQFGNEVEENLGDDEIREAVSEQTNVGELVGEVFGEEEVKLAFKEKIKKLLLEKIEEIESLDDLLGDDDNEEEFNLVDYLPEEFVISLVIANLLKQDEQAKEGFWEKIKGLLLDQIDKIDDDDLPDWEEFVEKLKINQVIESLADDQGVREKVRNKTIKVIECYIQDNFDSDDIPESFWDESLSPDKIRSLANDLDIRQHLDAELGTAIKKEVTNQLSDEESSLLEKLKENEDFLRVINQELQELLRNRDFLSRLQEDIKKKLLQDEDLSEKLLNKVFEQMANLLVEKLFNPRSY